MCWHECWTATHTAEISLNLAENQFGFVALFHRKASAFALDEDGDPVYLIFKSKLMLMLAFAAFTCNAFVGIVTPFKLMSGGLTHYFGRRW